MGEGDSSVGGTQRKKKVKQCQRHQGQKATTGGGKVCLGKEMLPCPLQQKAQASKCAQVEIPVLSF